MDICFERERRGKGGGAGEEGAFWVYNEERVEYWLLEPIDYSKELNRLPPLLFARKLSRNECMYEARLWMEGRIAIGMARTTIWEDECRLVGLFLLLGKDLQSCTSIIGPEWRFCRGAISISRTIKGPEPTAVLIRCNPHLALLR